RRDAAGVVPEPGGGPERRPDREPPLLGPAHRQGPVPGLRDQLRPPRLSGALVPAVEPLHVPLPRGRLLRRWLAPLRAARAGAVRVPVAPRAPGAVGPGEGDAHARSNGRRCWCEEAVMRRLTRIGEWLDARLQLKEPVTKVLSHPVPRNTASWFYVFGSASLT